MSDQYRSILNSVLIAIVSILLIGLIHNHPVIKSWSLHVEDLISRLVVNDIQQQDKAVIVTIDQNSLNTLKNDYNILWPFPRLLYSYVNEYLHYSGARAIAYDILFPQPDLERVNISSSNYSDSLFQSSMQQTGNVVLALQMEDSTHRTDNRFYYDNLNNLKIRIPSNVINHKYSQATLPLFKFQQAAQLTGAVNFYTDLDGTCRRIPLFYKYRDTKIPFLALATLLVAENIDKIYYDSLSHSIQAGKYNIPLSNNNFFNIKWYGPGGADKNFQYISFASLISSYREWKTGRKPTIPPQVFKDKAVFIGATAAGLWDMKPTPFSSQENPFPGVEIYATIYSNFINGETVRHVSFLPVAIFLLLVLIFFNLLWTRLNVYYSSGMSFLILGLPAIINILSFKFYSTHIPLIPVELAILLSLIVVNIVNYFTVDKRKKMIKNVFSHYMHPDVVDKLTNNYAQIEMGGEEITATVLFTDLEGFTKISEDLHSNQIVNLLNDYFEKAEKIIFRNSGMLDKYTGDGLMAIFGAPIYSESHGIQACSSILDFQELAEINIKLNGNSIPLITRVGVASGKIVVGNIGSTNRMDYTAVGDTVNLAARLEGVNKVYGTNNLISQKTYDLIKNEFVCREVDYIRVKGRAEPLKIYTVICNKNDSTENLQEIINIHNNALELYRERKFDIACQKFIQLLDEYPEDNLAAVYQKRCEKLMKNPDIIDADNIFNMKIK